MIASDKDYLQDVFTSLRQTSDEISNSTFEGCRFVECNFTETAFHECHFSDCIFERCNISLVGFNGSRLMDVEFENSKCVGIDWRRIKWPLVHLSTPITFYTCLMDQGYFFELHMADFVAERCSLKGADFRGADLSNGSFVESNLEGALFCKTNLKGCNFTGAANYRIDPAENDIARATFSFPHVVGLLEHLDINIEGLE